MSRRLLTHIDLKAFHCTVPEKHEAIDELASGRSGQVLTHAQKVLGIRSRHIASPDQTTAELMINSCQRLLEKLSWSPNSIDVLCCVTQTPDYLLPGNSFILQRECDLAESCLCIDLSHGCSGFTHGLTVIGPLLSQTPGQRGILVVGDTLSRFVSKDEPATNMLFGDGVGAIALESGNVGGTLFCAAGSEGKGLEHLYVPSTPTGLENTLRPGDTKEDRRFLHMNGMAVFNFSITSIPAAIQDTLGFAGLSINEIDYFVFHQANRFIIESITKKLHLPSERVITELEEFGNTSGASIPIALSKHFAPGTEQTVSGRFLFCGFGTGLSWSCVIGDMSGLRVFPIETI